MRRRRRVGGRKGAVDGDLSEGEDTMAGGDAGDCCLQVCDRIMTCLPA